MLEIILHLFERYETEFGENILYTVIKNLEETEGILFNVLDETNKKYELDFDSSCLEDTGLSYKFNLFTFLMFKLY